MPKALFLDRDGVINREINYLHRIADVEFLDGIFDISSAFYHKGYLLIVITNQAGIARGLYEEQDFLHLTAWMEGEFRQRGIEISATYYCPTHPTAGVGEYKRESADRKPNPGMILKAQKQFDLDLHRSVLLGDRETDIEAGINAGVGRIVLLTDNKESIADSRAHHVITSLVELLDIPGLP